MCILFYFKMYRRSRKNKIVYKGTSLTTAIDDPMLSYVLKSFERRIDFRLLDMFYWFLYREYSEERFNLVTSSQI